MTDVLDLSALGGERRKVKLPDGETYQMLSGGDLGPVLLNRFIPLFDEAQALQGADIGDESAPRLEEVLRELSGMVILDLPEPLAKSLSFQVCTRPS